MENRVSTCYEIHTNLKTKDQIVEVAAFITIISPEPATRYNTFTFASEDSQNLKKKKIQKFEEYFIRKINVIYERYLNKNYANTEQAI